MQHNLEFIRDNPAHDTCRECQKRICRELFPELSPSEIESIIDMGLNRVLFHEAVPVLFIARGRKRAFPDKDLDLATIQKESKGYVISPHTYLGLLGEKYDEQLVESFEKLMAQYKGIKLLSMILLVKDSSFQFPACEN